MEQLKPGDLLRELATPKCRHGEHSIELDCPPGSPRPGDLIAGVIEGTGLPMRDDVSRFFGNWKWEYNDVSCEEWDRVQPILKERIRKLYEGTNSDINRSRAPSSRFLG